MAHLKMNTYIHVFFAIFSRFFKYYPLAVICLGSLGNCISVLVFFGTKLRKQSSSYYLSSLAISDTLFLLTQLMSELTKVGIELFLMDGFCQFFIYLTQVKTNTMYNIIKPESTRSNV